jgi:peptide/bleomycin uptake transporter
MIVAGAIFAVAWAWIQPHRWYWWSVVGSLIILFVEWFQVQISVMLNDWYGTFYDMIQRALETPNSVTLESYYAQLVTVTGILMVSITVAVLNLFVVRHYVFRWRTAMNDYYVSHWERLRRIEGASQRVQEDTMRFASIMQGLGVAFIESIMTLVAFLPILWALSVHVKDVPILGAIPQALVVIAIGWSIFGTLLLAVTGIKLPGLEFRNQRVEAAYRKELVLGEDHAERALRPTLSMLFGDVRHNYFRLYFHYLYFDVVRYGYLQASSIIVYIALAPAIVAAAITFGLMQQILNAFSQVQSSFQFLVSSWTTIVELISIYKRLKAFEATLDDKPLGGIEQEVEPGASAAPPASEVPA